MVVIVNAFRTGIGKYGGSLAEKKPEELLETLFNNHFASAGLSPKSVDEVIIGQTKQSAEAANIARVASLASGIPVTTPAHTVQMQCGSGMQAIFNAWMSIETGHSEIMIAGGVESMSRAPFYMANNRFLPQTGNVTLFDSNTESQVNSQPETLFGKFNMGETAEFLAEKYKITREEQDEFAYMSQQKAKKAIEDEKFTNEIIPVEVKERKHSSRLFAADEHPREVTLEKLAKLKPVFKENGTVTAGNASGRNDGAATLLMMTEKRALELGLEPMAQIRSIASAGVHPKEMGLGPVPATKKALKKAGLELKDMDIIELNEAFAAQSLAVLKEWGLDHPRHVNVNGGAISLGHPLGSSGTRILVTLIHEMQKSGSRYGLATLCIAGGQGIATVIEKYVKSR
ncbi:thiolase family protein [Salipaludibacillus daqingensis]|uniref:thiolase family protein n=1 Tax=Salipaludibacillus daqingensis TaxID=3041001 RepID=UPI0024766C8A|nr:thiolase family protein [Salipaludibacillus daqingensis]